MKKLMMLLAIGLFAVSTAFAVLPPQYQNAKDLAVMVDFVKKHDRVMSELRVIDVEQQVILYGQDCKASFERKIIKKKPGWVGPAAPLAFKESTCPLSYTKVKQQAAHMTNKSSKTYDRLAGSEWHPVSIASFHGAGNAKSYLQFSADGQVSGFTGCNRLFGKYQLAKTPEQGQYPLTITAATTRMACPNKMAGEHAFLQMIRNTKFAELSHLTLTLYDAKHQRLGSLKRNDFD